MTVIENGGNCLMVNYNTIGLDAARMLLKTQTLMYRFLLTLTIQELYMSLHGQV